MSGCRYDRGGYCIFISPRSGARVHQAYFRSSGWMSDATYGVPRASIIRDVLVPFPLTSNGPSMMPAAPVNSPVKPSSATASVPPWLTPLAVFIVGALLLGTRPLQDQDIFFHLAAGRAIVEAGRLPAIDPFIFPLADTPTIYPEWGFEVLFHAAERIAGLTGVFALVALIGGLTAFMLYRIAVRWAPPAAAVAIVASAVAILEWRSLPRPEILLMLAVVAVVWAVPMTRDEDRRRWWWVPCIAWALAMCHPSVALLLGVAGALALEQTVRTRSALPLAAVAVAAVAACLTPYGIDQVLLPLKFMGDRRLIDGLAEFMPAFDTEYRRLFIAATVSSMIAIVVAGRRTSWGMVIVFAVIAVAAYRHARLISLLAVPMAVLLAVAWSVAGNWRRYLLFVVLAVTSTLAASIFLFGPRGIGLDARVLPEQAATRIASMPAGTRIANFFDFGAYLQWRLGAAYPLLVDGRNFDANRAVLLHDALFRADAGWERFLAENALNVVVTPPYMSASGVPVPLFFRLITHPDWIMTDAELAGVTFVRRTDASPQMQPVSLAKAWESALWILNEVLRADPANADAATERDRVTAWLQAATNATEYSSNPGQKSIQP